MKRLQYATAAVGVASRDGLVLASVEGIITPATVAEIIAGASGWARDPLAKVVDYGSARMQLTPEEMFAAAAGLKPGAPPTAFVVSRDHLGTFEQYSAIASQRGVLKCAFVNVEAARSWAADKARVRAYWGRLRRASAASP